LIGECRTRYTPDLHLDALDTTSSSCRFWADEFGLKPKQIPQLNPVFSIPALRFA
jgi:hypothetical protein